MKKLRLFVFHYTSKDVHKNLNKLRDNSVELKFPREF